MGQVLHGSARTTPAVRRAIQRSQQTVAALATRHGIDRKTVAKWRKRTTVENAPMGAKRPHSTVLSAEEEATVVAFRHLFDRVCAEHDIEHRLTKISHPWTNGQVERMNRTLKEATVRRYHYGSHAELREHL